MKKFNNKKSHFNKQFFKSITKLHVFFFFFFDSFFFLQIYPKISLKYIMRKYLVYFYSIFFFVHQNNLSWFIGLQKQREQEKKKSHEIVEKYNEKSRQLQKLQVFFFFVSFFFNTNLSKWKKGHVRQLETKTNGFSINYTHSRNIWKKRIYKHISHSKKSNSIRSSTKQ